MKVLLLNNGEEFSGVESLENELVKYINQILINIIYSFKFC